MNTAPPLMMLPGHLPQFDKGEEFLQDHFDADSTYSVSTYYTNNSNKGMPHFTSTSKKREWLVEISQRLSETPIGQLDTKTLPIPARNIMSEWARMKTGQGAEMVEMWLMRLLKESDAACENNGICKNNGILVTT
eukprot:CAMPEP_0195527986 /NCGR_PEP_ID=MMETSP0794_2-20130614/29944_1 /TAXON_ID=515487 /ORGANISM="Stephanopyxis turris, Strain CCMP 815" /LENGTH=134 /DNA_ID=CAMNT_0040659019 /DNA_START=39 /DNA_END=439 /DNA_ORIENTATION=+